MLHRLAGSLWAFLFVAAVAMATEQHAEVTKFDIDGILRHEIELTKGKPQLVIVEVSKTAPSVKVIEKQIKEEHEAKAEHAPQRDQPRKEQPEHHREQQHDQPRKEENKEAEAHKFKLNAFAKHLLLSGHASETFLAERMVEFYEENPETKFLKQCYAENLKVGEDSLDIVIDLAPSPSNDRVDKLLAESPLTHYVQQIYRTPSRAYFGAVELFIEAVTLNMDPHLTHTVLIDNKRKFFIRGRSADEDLSKQENFKDDKRHLVTLWPRPTKTVSESCIRHIVKNTLGHVTKQVLWNRDNGVPSVLAAKRHSKPFYTIVITDGKSGAKLNELTDDVSRTTVIDIGNRRFLNTLSFDELRKLQGNFFSFISPHELLATLDHCRVLACRFALNR